MSLVKISLCYHLFKKNRFLVITENGKGQSQNMWFKIKGQRRAPFLYDNHWVFIKVVNKKFGHYQFKVAFLFTLLVKTK